MTDQNATEQAVREAIDLLKRRYGSYAAGARVLGVTRQSLNDWKRNGSVPPNHTLALSIETGVSVHRISPDIFGPPPEMAKKKAERMEASAA